MNYIFNHFQSSKRFQFANVVTKKTKKRMQDTNIQVSFIISFTSLFETLDATRWNHFTKFIRHRCRTLNSRCSCLWFNTREIRYETTIKSEVRERIVEESKKLRSVNEKLVQFPISRMKKKVTCFLLLTEKIETGLTRIVHGIDRGIPSEKEPLRRILL